MLRRQRLRTRAACAQDRIYRRVDSARFRAERRELEIFQGLVTENFGQDLALTVLFVLYSLDSGQVKALD